MFENIFKEILVGALLSMVLSWALDKFDWLKKLGTVLYLVAALIAVLPLALGMIPEILGMWWDIAFGMLVGVLSVWLAKLANEIIPGESK